MDNQGDGITKKVLEISDKYELEFYKSKINNTYEVVTELKKNNTCIGHTTNYIPVILDK